MHRRIVRGIVRGTAKWRALVAGAPSGAVGGRQGAVGRGKVDQPNWTLLSLEQVMGLYNLTLDLGKKDR